MRFPYTRSNRLADVLSLMQILAKAPVGQRTIDKLIHLLGEPHSYAKNWKTIAEEHKEFFYISEGKGCEISLIARRYNKQSEPMSQDDVSKLMETAISIYNTQLNHSRWWIFFMPIIGAFIGAILGVLIK